MKKLFLLLSLLAVGFSGVSCSSVTSLSPKKLVTAPIKGSINGSKRLVRGLTGGAASEAELADRARREDKKRLKKLKKMAAATPDRRVRTTAYSHEEREMGGIYGNRNAVGTVLKYGPVRSAAADWSLYPVGTQFKIKGQPHIYEVDDYGSALVGTGTIDLYKPNLGMMRNWGVRHVDIEILRWGSYSRSLHILEPRQQKARHVKAMVESIRSKSES